jgi:hypothetical protein
VIDTNLMGQVHGSRAAVQQFRRQGHGTLINIHITTLLPEAIDTPIFANAANYSGRRPPIPPC